MLYGVLLVVSVSVILIQCITAPSLQSVMVGRGVEKESLESLISPCGQQHKPEESSLRWAESKNRRGLAAEKRDFRLQTLITTESA